MILAGYKMASEPESESLRVAIIGGGPGGLATAIALSSIPNVDVNLYEKASELREIGAGLNIGYNSWRVLELLGVDIDINGHLINEVQQRYAYHGNRNDFHSLLRKIEVFTYQN